MGNDEVPKRDQLGDIDLNEDEISEWTPEHLKLLYLISLYSHCSTHSDEKDKWVRKIPLMVLIYEGIVNQVFDYDYAPASEIIGTRHVYVNISQEGRDDVDDLREGGMINGLKLSSKEYQPVTCYRISVLGSELLELVPDEFRKEIDDYCHDPNTGELMEVQWDGEEFHMVSPSGHRVRSSITDTEDVSYVSSPYLPVALREYGRQPTSNADRVDEIKEGITNIRDELSEVITLDNVSILVGEWVPFGANQVCSLNDKLGSGERVQGGLFCALVDQEPEGTQFEVEPELTSVQILDFDASRYLNFEAEVYYPEDEGVVQVENFGVHIHEDGFVCFGLFVEAIMDRLREKVSLDLLARLLVDIHQDSSKIMDSLISQYQRALLDMTYIGDAYRRDKFNVIMCENINPMMKAEKYMDKEEHENELKQVLGDTQSAHDLSEDELLVIGHQGILVCGANSRRHEDIILAYLRLMGRSIFLRNFFHRLFALHDTLKRIRDLIDTHEKNPNSITQIRNYLSHTSKDIIMLSETLGYLNESLELKHLPDAIENDEASCNLRRILNIDRTHDEMVRRCQDLGKNIDGARHELDGLREMTDVISETQMFRLQEAMNSNTKNLEEMFRSNERASSSLEIMQVILSGTLAFEILDRVTGEWSVADTPWAKSYIIEPLVEKPGVWFVTNMGLWGLIGYLLIRFMRYLTESAAGVLTVRYRANLPIDLEKLKEFLETKDVQEEDVDFTAKSENKKVAWEEEGNPQWQGGSPKIEIQIDVKHSYLLSVYAQLNKKDTPIREAELKEGILRQLRDAHVVDLAKLKLEEDDVLESSAPGTRDKNAI